MRKSATILKNSQISSENWEHFDVRGHQPGAMLIGFADFMDFEWICYNIIPKNGTLCNGQHTREFG